MHLAHRPLVMSPVNAKMAIQDARLGYVSTAAGEPRRNKVAIVGAGHYRDEAPYDDPEWEVWALNVCSSWDNQGRLRADRWFEIHEAKAQSTDDMEWIRKCPVPLYLPPAFAEPFLDGRAATVVVDTPNTEGGLAWRGSIPNAVRFPLERLEAAYGGYWACTFAYQMALALNEGFTDVGLYGVELAWGTARERTVEWACVSWWCGYLEAKGVTMHYPNRCSLGRHPFRYGIEYDEEIVAVNRYLQKSGQFDRLRAGVMGG